MLVSVIIPMYNGEKYIERCLTSLTEQNYKRIEILIVDDGSLDGSGSLVKEYQKKDSRISYFYQENQGPGTARNFAIKQARGKYLLFVDADDYVESDYIENLVQTAETSQSDLTIAGYTLAYDNHEKDKQIIPQFYIRGSKEEWAYRISASCSRLYRRDFWISNSLEFNQERNARAEDVPIALYANVMAKNISITKNPGYCYYQHPESAMNNKNKKVLFGFPYKAFEKMYKLVKSSTLENSEDFFHLGVLKFLAQFDLVIYKKADREEKERFYQFFMELLSDFESIEQSWKRLRFKCAIPIVHKAAIEIFIIKCKKRRKDKTR